MTNKRRLKHSPNTRRKHNLRPGVVLILLPLFAAVFTIFYFVSGRFDSALGRLGNERLVTDNWQAADDAFNSRMPDYERQYAYYRLKDGQTLDSVADYFSVDKQTLARLNPGSIVAGTTVKVPPVEHPLVPTSGPNQQISHAVITEDHGLIRVRQSYRYPLAVTDIPELMVLLKKYDAIQQTGPKTYLINRAISVESNVRLDITSQTVQKLVLRSSPHDIVCLCTDEASMLMKDVEVTTLDPATGKPDANFADERSFVRNKNGRFDAINTKFSYLGNDLSDAQKSLASTNQAQKEGGTYGVSWRISDDKLGVEIATGWVENSSFEHNHFGAYSFGASGMTWRNNYFAYNDVYGLDPHDDSNNALIEDNVFANNGKHGFIMSKRCDYNIIRNNTSYGNALHGFMLHQDSAYNLVENNVAYDNTDNYVIFASDYNTIRANISFNARSSHVRINEGSRNNYVVNNQFVGGRRGVFIYGAADNIYISDNSFHIGKEVLTTDGAKNVFFGDNSIDQLSYKIGSSDRLIFGPNKISDLRGFHTPATPPLPVGYTAKS